MMAPSSAPITPPAAAVPVPSRVPSIVWPLLATIALTGLAVRLSTPLAGPGRAPTAFLGIELSAIAGGVGLILKRRALEHGIRPALSAMGLSFFLRVLLLVMGAVWVRSHGQNVTVFGVAFLAFFGALQWVEIGYVMVAAKRMSAGLTSSPTSGPLV